MGSHAIDNFGWQFKVDFREGLRRTVGFTVKALAGREK